MMLILKEREIYLIDRDNNVFAAPQFHFPQRKNLREHIFDTLIDGVRERSITYLTNKLHCERFVVVFSRFPMAHKVRRGKAKHQLG